MFNGVWEFIAAVRFFYRMISTVKWLLKETPLVEYALGVESATAVQYAYSRMLSRPLSDGSTLIARYFDDEDDSNAGVQAVPPACIFILILSSILSSLKNY